MHKRCYLVVWKKHWFDWVWRSTTSAAPRRGDCMAKATKPAMARLSKACWSATLASKKSSKIKIFQGNRSEKGGSLFLLLCHFAAGLGLISSLLYVIPMSRPNHYVMLCHKLWIAAAERIFFKWHDQTTQCHYRCSKFFCQFSFTKKKGSQLTATLWDLHIFFQQQPASLSYHLQLTEDFQLSPCSSVQTPNHIFVLRTGPIGWRVKKMADSVGGTM